MGIAYGQHQRSTFNYLLPRETHQILANYGWLRRRSANWKLFQQCLKKLDLIHEEAGRHENRERLLSKALE